MGGFPSCLRMPDKEEENRGKPSQYEEIDDNFTILTTDNNDKNATNHNVTATSSPKNADVINDNVTYANVSTTNQNNLRTYVPNKTMNSDPEQVCEIQNVLYTSTTNDVTTASSKQHYNKSTRPKENHYENCDVTSQRQPQSSSSEIQYGAESERLANQNPENGAQTEDQAVSEVMKVKENKGNRKKTQDKVPPPTKPKKNLFKLKGNPETNKECSNKDNQLTYIEVEFATPPSDANKNGGKRPSLSNTPTAYTDVVHEGGRLVLIR